MSIATLGPSADETTREVNEYMTNLLKSMSRGTSRADEPAKATGALIHVPSKPRRTLPKPNPAEIREQIVALRKVANTASRRMLLEHAQKQHRGTFLLKTSLVVACGLVAFIACEVRTPLKVGLAATAWAAAAVGLIAVLELVAYRARAKARFDRLCLALPRRCA